MRRGLSHDYNTNDGDNSRSTKLAGLGGGSGADTTCDIRARGCAGHCTSCHPPCVSSMSRIASIQRRFSTGFPICINSGWVSLEAIMTVNAR
jgi:hypothetical protein